MPCSELLVTVSVPKGENKRNCCSKVCVLQLFAVSLRTQCYNLDAHVCNCVCVCVVIYNFMQFLTKLLTICIGGIKAHFHLS